MVGLPFHLLAYYLIIYLNYITLFYLRQEIVSTFQLKLLAYWKTSPSLAKTASDGALMHNHHQQGQNDKNDWLARGENLSLERWFTIKPYDRIIFKVCPTNGLIGYASQTGAANDIGEVVLHHSNLPSCTRCACCPTYTTSLIGRLKSMCHWEPHRQVFPLLALDQKASVLLRLTFYLLKQAQQTRFFRQIYGFIAEFLQIATPPKIQVQACWPPFKK